MIHMMNLAVLKDMLPFVSLLIIPPLDRRLLLPTNNPLLHNLVEILTLWHDVMAQYIPKNFVVKYLIFSEQEVFVKGKWWSVVSSMFVHGSYDHLFNNAFSLCVTSPHLLTTIGNIGVYGGFLIGGIFGSLNWNARHYQMKQIYENWIHLPKWFRLPEWFNAQLGGLSRRYLTHFINYYRPQVQTVGCSGGTMSLLGMSFAQNLDLILCHCDQQADQSIWPVVLNSFQIGFCLKSDVINMYQGVSTNVDHAAHVSGFFCGMMLYGLLYRKFSFKKSRRFHYLRK